MDLTTLLDDHQMFHSDFQIDNFIIVRSGETQYGQYKQILRELSSRYKTLKDSYISRELLVIDIEELEEEFVDGFQKRRNDLKLIGYRMSLDESNKTITDIEREFKRFYALACKLKKLIGDLIPERRHVLDRDMWLFKLKSMAAADFITTGRIKDSTLTFIRSMPIELRIPLMSEIINKDELINWFNNYDNPLPSVDNYIELDIKKLLK